MLHHIIHFKVPLSSILIVHGNILHEPSTLLEFLAFSPKQGVVGHTTNKHLRFCKKFTIHIIHSKYLLLKI